jgi:hypothetical protein
MPGFYKSKGDLVEWKSFDRLPGSSMEMSVKDAEVFWSHVLPRLKGDLIAEGCDTDEIDFEFSMCSPEFECGFGQIMAAGTSRVPISPNWDYRTGE